MDEGLRCSCEWRGFEVVPDEPTQWNVMLDPACPVHRETLFPESESVIDLRDCQTFGHPFPWRHETDWSEEIYDAKGRIVAKIPGRGMTPQAVRVLRAIAVRPTDEEG